MAAKTAKQTITVYRMGGGFGASTGKGTLVEIRDGKTTSGKVVKVVEFIPAGKRKSVTASGEKMVVLAGDHPEAWDGIDKTPTGGSTRWGSFDPRYEDMFNIEMNTIIRDKREYVMLDTRTDADRAVKEVRKVNDLD